MKRKTILAVAAVLSALSVAWFILWPKGNIPRYTSGRDITVPNDPEIVSYDFLNRGSSPGQGIWVFAGNEEPRSGCEYLINPETGVPIGRLENAGVLTLGRDGDDVLCYTADMPKERDAQSKIFRFLDKFFDGALHNRQFQYSVHLWTVPTRGGKRKYLGTYTEQIGLGSAGKVSPDRRYWYVESRTDGFVLVDMEKKTASISERRADRIFGWWSGNEIIEKHHGDGRFLLHNVETQEEKILFTPDQISEFLRKEGLRAADLDYTHLLSSWNGKEYSFFMVGIIPERMAKVPISGTDWLLEIDKADMSLKVKKRSFDRKRLGNFNGNGNLYVYCGERETENSSAVYLLDLEEEETVTLIPAQSGEVYYSAPTWFGDRIIFYKKKELWIMNADGSNQRCFFPPPSARDVNRERGLSSPP